MVIDALFLIIAGWGFFIGFSRGIIKTVFTFFSVVFGIMAAMKFGPAATRFLETAFDGTSAWLFFAGTLLAFVLTMVIIRMFANGLEGILESANINIINKFMGGMLFGALVTLMYSILLWVGEQAHVVTAKTTDTSMTYSYLEQFPSQMRKVYDIAAPSFKEFWDEAVEAMDKMQETVERTESDPAIYDIPEKKEERTNTPNYFLPEEK